MQRLRYFSLMCFVVLLCNCNDVRKDKTTDRDSIPFTVTQPVVPEKKYNVIDFGAVGNGTTLDTRALQNAIDSCAANNGGTIYFPPGIFRTGTLYLSSSLRLHLERGAILLGSDNLEDYPETIQSLRSYTDNYTVRSMIYAEGKENIVITGEGMIDGQGWKFPVQYHPYKIRPYIIRMIECKNILIENVTILNSPMWVQHYLACDHLTFRNITVSSRRSNVNNDGLDIDGCHNVLITGSWIYAQDDAIVFKSTMERSCENILVENCTLSSLANALKCGTESNGGFRNITIRNCHLYNTGYSGIALEIVDGGVLENISITDITMDHVKNPIFIRLGNRARAYREDMQPPPVGSVRNITIKNIHATNVGYFWEEHPFFKIARRPAHIPSSITGIPGHIIENVHLENIYIQYTGGHESQYDTSQVIPEKEDGYPDYHMFGQLPASAFYLRHVKNIYFNNINVEFTKTDTRPLFYLDINTENVYRDGVALN